MVKLVSETKAGKSISAYVIMQGYCQVATVRAHFGDTGRVLVNVWQDNDACMRCAEATGMEVDPREACERFAFQHASASGHGYDKFTAALAGLWIDGHQLSDHCAVEMVPASADTGVWPAGYTAPIGYTLANWSGERAGWLNCYRLPSLDYLKDRGYAVVQAI